MPEKPEETVKIEILDHESQEHAFSAPDRQSRWGDVGLIDGSLEKRQALSTWKSEGWVASSKNPVVWNAAFEAFQEAWLEKFEGGGVDVQPPFTVELVFNFIGQGLDTGKADLYETNVHISPLYDDVRLGDLSDFANKVEKMTVEKTKHLPHSDRL